MSLARFFIYAGAAFGLMFLISVAVGRLIAYGMGAKPTPQPRREPWGQK